MRAGVTVETAGGILEAGVYVWKHPDLCRYQEPEWSYEEFRADAPLFKSYVDSLQNWKEGGMSVDEYLENRLV